MNKDKDFLYNRNLGQNFLFSDKYLKKIENIISLPENIENRNIIEIGPGAGVLTKMIIKGKFKTLKLIEKDKRLIGNLEKFTQDLLGKNFQIICGDCLVENLDCDIIITNLPYNITQQFLLRLFLDVNFSKAYLMIQKEVADKITCKFSNRNYGFLSAVLGATFKISQLFDVPAEAFYPKPKVESCFIEIVNLNYDSNYNFNRKKYINICRRLFENRNKKIKNLFKLSNSEFDEKRPLELSPQNILELMNLIL